ncbi:hypothetical protein C8Q74DRAFT_1233637 [Fomes fomentarius]|nr:hypothetical protein C8Q74DRAFT_1233637 [Fomes fomentarius]
MMSPTLTDSLTYPPPTHLSSVKQTSAATETQPAPVAAMSLNPNTHSARLNQSQTGKAERLRGGCIPCPVSRFLRFANVQQPRSHLRCTSAERVAASAILSQSRAAAKCAHDVCLCHAPVIQSFNPLPASPSSTRYCILSSNVTLDRLVVAVDPFSVYISTI